MLGGTIDHDVVDQPAFQAATPRPDVDLNAVFLYVGARSQEQAATVLSLPFGNWLLVGVGIRTPYIELFRKAITRGGPEREFMLTELDLTSVETLVEALAQMMLSFSSEPPELE